MSLTGRTPSVPQQLDDPIAAEQLMEMRVDSPSADVCVLSVSGEVDMFTAPALDSMVARQLASWPRVLVLDLCDVQFLSSVGLASLMAAREKAEEVGAQLRLACIGGPVQRPLEITGLAELFDVYPDLNAALRALS